VFVGVIQQAVQQIAAFMAQFSSLITDAPRFLRLGIELKSLSTFGINFEELTMFEGPMLTTNKSHDDSGGSANVAGSDSGVSVYGGDDSRESAEAKQFPTPPQVTVLACHQNQYLTFLFFSVIWQPLRVYSLDLDTISMACDEECGGNWAQSASRKRPKVHGRPQPQCSHCARKWRKELERASSHPVYAVITATCQYGQYGPFGKHG
jgi:hypothetical protein